MSQMICLSQMTLLHFGVVSQGGDAFGDRLSTDERMLLRHAAAGHTASTRSCGGGVSSARGRRRRAESEIKMRRTQGKLIRF